MFLLQVTTIEELLTSEGGALAGSLRQQERNAFLQIADQALTYRRAIYDNTLPDAYKKQAGLTQLCVAVAKCAQA